MNRLCLPRLVDAVVNALVGFATILGMIIAPLAYAETVPSEHSPMSVVFISPGKAEEPYWRSVDRFIQPAAQQLGISFEVLHAERNHVRAVELLSEVIRRRKKPDYLIIVNEKAIGPIMLKMADHAHIPTLLSFSALDPEIDKDVGLPRTKYKYWLGSLTPNSRNAGRLAAIELVAAARRAHLQAPDGNLHVAMIAGDRVTPTSRLRTEGAQAGFNEQKDVVLDQIVYGDWERVRAFEQTQGLLLRYPKLAAIWCASDLMAFGAMDALPAAHWEAGKDIMLSAFNNSADALQARLDNRLSALASGHFTLGAWALVMLYDYHHGRDFVQDGLEQKLDLFSILNEQQAAKMLQRFGKEDFSSIDFRSFSKTWNPGLRHYSFDLTQILN